MKTYIVDANIFIRLLIPENQSLFAESKEFLERAGAGKIRLLVPQIIIFEINYTLTKYYHFEKKRVAEALESIVNNNSLEVESQSIFGGAVEVYKDTNLDLTDCFLIEKSRLDGIGIKSFDKKLNKYAKIS